MLNVFKRSGYWALHRLAQANTDPHQYTTKRVTASVAPGPAHHPLTVGADEPRHIPGGVGAWGIEMLLVY